MDVVERKRPRGTFLNLFDWPGKSRKKLFSSNISQLSEDSKQAKENVQNPSVTRHSVFEVEQTVKNSTYNPPRSDSSCCASSVTSDDGNVVRAPSVVARLMGLECLPLPNDVEPRVNPVLDPYFLRSSRQANTWDADVNANADHQSDLGGVSWDHLDSRTSKGPRKRMIERFQTETLPPRSAKPISVTHNKLLSPIRNPGFVPSRSPAYVMEAASKMIESSPRMVARTRVVSSCDSSSPVPLRIRDLKEKLEAAQKASTSFLQISNDTRNSKYQRGDQNEKKTTTLFGKSNCEGLKSEVKPPSFSAQAKTSSNQKQDSKTTSSSGIKRTSLGPKEKAEAKNRAVKSQSSLKGSSLSSGKNVLKQNNQKQNCRDNQQSRKVLNKVVNKVLVESGSTSKSPGFTMSSAEKSTSSTLSRKKSLPRNKKTRNGVEEPGIYDDKRIKRSEKSIKCNISIDGDSSTTTKDDQKRDMDVISFTFSSSIKGLSSHSQGTKQDADSAVKFNVIGGDSLNALLEQKLRELTSKMESSSSNLIQEESLSCISKDRVNGMISPPSKHGELTRNSLVKVLSESESVSDCTSIYNNQKPQKAKMMVQGEEHEVSSISTLTEADDFALSCNKSFSDCDREYGMKQSSSDQELTWFSSNESYQTIVETDSAATPDWELQYITEILNSGQIMFQDFASGTATEELLLPSSLFDEMERSRGAAMSMKIERKVLFDCVNQCLAVKFERLLIGSCKGMMMTGGILLEHRNLLAEELNREVKVLKKMREMMIDELVDHDMSCFEGRWVGYEREMFEEGIDIEGEIVSALVDDLVSDLFLHGRS